MPTSLQRCFFTLVIYLSFPNLSTYAVCSLSIAQLSWFVLLYKYILRPILLSTTIPSTLIPSSLHDNLLPHSLITQRSDAYLILLVGRGTYVAAQKSYIGTYKLYTSVDRYSLVRYSRRLRHLWEYPRRLHLWETPRGTFTKK